MGCRCLCVCEGSRDIRGWRPSAVRPPTLPPSGNANPTISRNIVKENKKGGVLINGARGTFANNEVLGNMLDGVTVLGVCSSVLHCSRAGLC